MGFRLSCNSSNKMLSKQPAISTKRRKLAWCECPSEGASWSFSSWIVWATYDPVEFCSRIRWMHSHLLVYHLPPRKARDSTRQNGQNIYELGFVVLFNLSMPMPE